jgi:hypothetical protein
VIPPSLVRGFFSPGHPVELRHWTGRADRPGIYVDAGVFAAPDRLAGALTRAGGGVVRIAFDPEATVARLVTEAGAPGRRPVHSRLPLRASWIPALVREALLRLSVGPRLTRPGFPRWPAEPLVEDIRALVREAASAAGSAPADEPLWPDGTRYAAALSHDCDGGDVFRHDRWKALAEIEEAHGLRSSWHLCSVNIAEAIPALEALAGRGHEIAWHGPRHDYRFAYHSRERIRREAARAVLDLGAFGIRGFRSPNFIRTPALFGGLDGVLGYDSSVRDTAAELFGPGRQGCCTVFPFFHGSLVELPITIPDDLSIRCLHGDVAEAIIRSQLGKLDWIRSVGGMALVLTHPEPWISLMPGSLKAYRLFVERIANDPDAWRPLPRDIEAWWRERSKGDVPA